MARLLQTRITHLQMTEPTHWHQPAPLKPRLAMMCAPNIPLSFYRYLYEQVGKPHHWSLRRNMDDERLAQEIHAETTRIHVLYADGSPAGFFELDQSALPDCNEIVYLGLAPEFQGQGLGRFLLSEAIAAAWEERPACIRIQTNTLDNPRALGLYQLAGFVPCGWEEDEIEAWE